jgi:hypothetical protein
VTIPVVGADPETRALLTCLAAAHGVPANITGLPNGRHAEPADQIEATLAASPEGLTRDELAVRVPGQLSVKVVEETLSDMRSTKRVVKLKDHTVGKPAVRWTSPPPTAARSGP